MKRSSLSREIERRRLGWQFSVLFFRSFVDKSFSFLFVFGIRAGWKAAKLDTVDWFLLLKGLGFCFAWYFPCVWGCELEFPSFLSAASSNCLNQPQHLDLSR